MQQSGDWNSFRNIASELKVSPEHQLVGYRSTGAKVTMKNMAWALIACLLSGVSAFGQGPIAPPGLLYGKKVELYNVLPSELKLKVGESVWFVGDTRIRVAFPRTVTAHQTDNQAAPLFNARPVDTTARPDNTYMIYAWRTTRVGEGELRVVLDKAGTIHKIKVIVTPLPPQSGVKGQVTEGPLMGNPPKFPGVKSQNYRTVPGATVIAEDKDGKEVARTTSDKDGNFQLALPPGVYRLVPVHPSQRGGLPKPLHQYCKVKVEEWTESNLRFDTMID